MGSEVLDQWQESNLGPIPMDRVPWVYSAARAFPQKRWKKIGHRLENYWQEIGWVSARALARLVGKMNANPAPLTTSKRIWPESEDYKTTLRLSPKCKKELSWQMVKQESPFTKRATGWIRPCPLVKVKNQCQLPSPQPDRWWGVQVYEGQVSKRLITYMVH